VAKKAKLLLKTIVYVSLFFSATFWSTIPSISGLLPSFSSMILSNENFSLQQWILYQRTNVLSQLFMVPNTVYFFNTFSVMFIVGSLGLFLLLFLSLRKVNKISLIFIILGLISIFITAKGQGIISDTLTLKIFTLPILNVLRSLDKTFVFLPFFFIMAIFVGLQKYWARIQVPIVGPKKVTQRLKSAFSRRNKVVIIVCCLAILIGVYPFFTGGIQTQYNLSFTPGQNYQTAKYSYLVQIPSDYYTAASLISQDNYQNRILNLPFSVVSSYDWVNYPPWKLVGVDPTCQLFTKPSIEPNDGGSPFWQQWNSETPENASWMIKLMSLYNAQYLIYHKDVDGYYAGGDNAKIEALVQEGYLNLMDDNSYFQLYNLTSAYFLPHLFTSSNITLVDGTSDQLLSSIESSNIQVNNAFFVSNQTSSSQWQSLINYPNNITARPTIVFQEINPTKYQVEVQNATGPFFLIFSESYTSNWKAYAGASGTLGTIIANYTKMQVEEAKSSSSFSPTDLSYLVQQPLSEKDHYVVNGYANAWYIDPAAIGKNNNGSFQVTLYFKPQSYYYMGLIVSGATLGICVIALTILPIVIRKYRKQVYPTLG